MGQKTHPHGLRVGVHRKWNSSWFVSTNELKQTFNYQLQAENFIKTIFHLYPYTKFSNTKRALLVDVKLFKHVSGKLYVFILFYKFRTKKRKENLNRFINRNNKSWTNFDSLGNIKV